MRIPIAAALCALALAAGCGDESGGKTLSEARQDLIDDCHKGNEGDERDLKLCQCIADQLARKHGYDTAAEFEKARKDVANEDIPSEVRAAVAAPECQKIQQP